MYIQTKVTLNNCIIDETQIQIASTEAWLWVAAIEPIHRMVLGVYLCPRHGNIYASCRDILKIID